MTTTEPQSIALTATVEIAPQANEKVNALYEQALRLAQFANALVITSEDHVKGAVNDLSIISGLKKAIEAERKKYVQPLKDHLDAVNSIFKVFTEPLTQANDITRQKMLDYRTMQELIRQEQERINQMKLETAKAEMELKGELTDSVNLVEVAPEAPTTIRTNMGSAGQTDHWKHEVTDFSLLPDEYKVSDTVMLNAIAKKHHDQKQIPGVRFYNEPFITVRPVKVGE